MLVHANTVPAELLFKGVKPSSRVYKLVLTGGPCGGKTTGQAKLATFFENLGWKVFRVPETATVLMSGGIAFGELNHEQIEDFQENLVRTMIALEDTYFSMASKFSDQNVLIICDRGVMDASAYIDVEGWRRLLDKVDLDESSICEGRYDHVIHMVSAANGAEDFYTCEEHSARFEGLEEARSRDRKAVAAWQMHPYLDVVDNRVDFDTKLKHLVDIVVKRAGIKIGDQFNPDSRKVKFVVKGPLPKDEMFPSDFTDFDVEHHYLQTNNKGIQSRIRKRGHNGRWTYTCTVRRPEKKGQIIEEKTPLAKNDYEMMVSYADPRTLPIYKTRRCFLWRNQQYQLDIYRSPCHPRCNNLMLLETFTTLPSDELVSRMPPFLKIRQEVTGDPAFSMFNLSLKSDWMAATEQFIQRLESSDSEDEDQNDHEVQMAFSPCFGGATENNGNGETNGNLTHLTVQDRDRLFVVQEAHKRLQLTTKSSFCLEQSGAEDSQGAMSETERNMSALNLASPTLRSSGSTSRLPATSSDNAMDESAASGLVQATEGLVLNPTPATEGLVLIDSSKIEQSSDYSSGNEMET